MEVSQYQSDTRLEDGGFCYVLINVKEEQHVHFRCTASDCHTGGHKDVSSSPEVEAKRLLRIITQQVRIIGSIYSAIFLRVCFDVHVQIAHVPVQARRSASVARCLAWFLWQ